MLNLAVIQEAISERIPDAEALVYRDRRLSWSQVTDRTRRLADVLRRSGLGCRKERSALENWESGQDHVGLYMHNGNEYLESMMGAFKARTAPFNVNYRYVDEELIYLFDNADARAIVFHAAFAPALARIRDKLPKVDLWIQVADESGEGMLRGAIDYEQALAEAEPAPLPDDLSPDDLYILYTGGTTGMPKGVLWRQEDIFHSALYSGNAKSLEEVADRAARGGPRVLAAPPFMHGAAHWVALNMWHVGGTVVVQSDVKRLDPVDIWSTIAKEGVTALTIVGDAFGRPLADELRRGNYDVSSLRLLTSGGAILTASLKQEFLDLIPGLRILDALGSSESGTQAAQYSKQGEAVTTGDFKMNPDNVVLNEDLSAVLAAGSTELGWLARGGRVPLGYYRDPEKTRATFPIVEGMRYSVPGDRATLEPDGTLKLLGRDSVTINTGGEKVFAEEVEQALKHHPDVYDTVVVPTPHERWGQQVTAIVRLREGVGAGEGVGEGEATVSDVDAMGAALKKVALQHIAAYKLPKQFIFVDEIVRSPSGKADYRWAKSTALRELGIDA